MGDIPPWALNARKELQRKKAELLNPSRLPEWNPDTNPGHKCERSSHKILEFAPKEYQFNYRTEVLPRARETTEDVFGRILKLNASSVSASLLQGSSFPHTRLLG